MMERTEILDLIHDRENKDLNANFDAIVLVTAMNVKNPRDREIVYDSLARILTYINTVYAVYIKEDEDYD
jgi:hypothetical protein